MANSKTKPNIQTRSAKNTAQKKKLVKAVDQYDIIKIILADHQPLKKWIKILKNTEKSLVERKKALEEFAPLLINHAQAEERALYSFMERNKDLCEESFEGEVEHELAELMLESSSTEKNENMWSAKIKVLAELVEHHIREEEREVFPDVRKMTTVKERLEMGAKYLDFKEQYDLPIEQHDEERHVSELEHEDDDIERDDILNIRNATH